ncbi:ABC transporter permease [Saccharopolyspora phatthalungensis]|uniref:Ribose transport system permease protein n=1 Tax=Saccharopolyspora phatthalungensis TaxID=664693 RepID=A0A840QGT6_9PSEU|nr:ABC transporter permease [Saccharopolyspora phatthalungensis]MBB5159337.1 ribose transport system permease protein [Saccharopolyspora phatthalungensis]
MSLGIHEPVQRAARARRPRLRLPRGPFVPVWAMTAVLFAISPLIAPGSLSGAALSSMLPFASILVLAALGQAFVITQRGIDLSVPGAMALAALFATKVPELTGLPLAVSAVLGLLAGAAGGLVIGVLVVRFGIAAFVATLAMNTILIGVVLEISKGFPASANPAVSAFATGSLWTVPNLLIVAVILVAITQWLRRRSVPGRRFVSVGANPAAARLLGIRAEGYQVSAYAIGGLLYAVAGLLLAAYLRTPDILLGNTYQLSSIAAVVLGGSLLTGGMSSAVATGVAALFLTQLNQVVLAAGAATSIQLLVQAAVLALAVVMRRVPLSAIPRRLSGNRATSR